MSTIIKISKRRFKGGKVTARNRVMDPRSIGDVTNERNNNLTRSIDDLINGKVNETVGIINIDKSERSSLR